MKEWHDTLDFQYGSLENYMDEQYPITIGGAVRKILFNPDEPFWLLMAILCSWPWLTLLTLLIFSRSLKKAQMKYNHLVRIVVYNSDAIIWFCAYCIGASTWYLVSSKLFFRPIGEGVLTGLLVAFGASSLLWLYRLAVAFIYYLRIDRPIWTAFTSQVLVAFIAFDVVMLALFGW